MKTKNKIITAVLAAVMVVCSVFAFTACGGVGGSSANDVLSKYVKSMCELNVKGALDCAYFVTDDLREQTETVLSTQFDRVKSTYEAMGMTIKTSCKSFKYTKTAALTAEEIADMQKLCKEGDTISGGEVGDIEYTMTVHASMQGQSANADQDYSLSGIKTVCVNNVWYFWGGDTL